MPVTETIYYLELVAEADLHPAAKVPGQIELKKQTVPDPRLSRYLYSAVGRDYHWTVRAQWTDEQWLERLGLPNVEMWVAYEWETVAGYFELAMDEERSVEIAYFCLVPQFIGRGVGWYLLTAAVQQAWQMSATLVWLHTSSRDHPRSLANYQARGFRVFKQEVVNHLA